MLVSTQSMLTRAARGGYAVGQFNINNLEWIRAAMSAARDMEAPVILGVTESACAYMGGLRAVRALVEGMAGARDDLPMALHLDHAGEDMCLQAIGAGFSSVMFDGSKLPFAENLRVCAKLAAICRDRGVSLEAELGSPAGEEDGISGSGDKALPSQCAELARSGISSLAAAIGNIHGEYPAGWPGLDLALLREIRAAVKGLPLVLHGGSGIPDAMVRESIGLGICKINVNTECQLAFAEATKEYFASGRDLEPGGRTLQKVLAPGTEAVARTIREKIRFFGSAHTL
ncbi:MAG: ketose-bisphosphate aldolase [Desulfovibrionaceae bacterium]|nr:ketose-bisphosphate aldolase [Desulfovibrionaceae bacterium]